MASSTWFIIPLHGAKSHNSKLITYDPYDLICQNIFFLNFGISFRDFYFYQSQSINKVATRFDVYIKGNRNDFFATRGADIAILTGFGMDLLVMNY
jgi:hypothetical protein